MRCPKAELRQQHQLAPPLREAAPETYHHGTRGETTRVFDDDGDQAEEEEEEEEEAAAADEDEDGEEALIIFLGEFPSCCGL